MTLSRITTEWCKQMLVSDYDESQRKLAEVNKALLGSLTPTSSGLSFAEPVGELPFGAKLYTVDSISATDLLSNLKTAFSGKALLIDCWATWCGPCIGEFPYSKKLSAACKDLPLEFVYICTTGGSPMDTWKSKIVEHQISGTHLYVDNRIVGDLLKMFSSAGYPTYAFIDRQGTYRPEAQIRPSSTSREQLIQLVK